MTVYRIVDWDRHFENNRTRELKFLNYVPIPNKMDGDGYTELLDHEDGAAHFGAWCAILEIASRCVPRGLLIRHVGTIPQGGAGECGAIPQGGAMTHTCATLSRMSRIKRDVYEAVIPRLISLGWVDDIDITDKDLQEMSHLSRTIPHPPAETRLSRARPSPSPTPTPTPNGKRGGGKYDLSDPKIAGIATMNLTRKTP